MKQVRIVDLKNGIVPGIEVLLPGERISYHADYFEWLPSTLTVQFQKKFVSGGVLQAWRHAPIFQRIETHPDAELFFFISGVALMLFMEMSKDQPDLESAQIVRIRPGSQIIIPAGKAPYVPVAEDTHFVEMVVISPKMEATCLILPEAIEGIP